MIKDLINERVLILLIFLVIISQKKIKVIVEDFSNSFNHKCDYGMAEVLKKVTKERGMVKKNKGYDFYFPCSYNYCEYESKKLKPENDDQKFFLLDGCDSINSKIALWNAIFNKFGRDKARQIMPNTFLLSKPDEMKEFTKFFYESKKINPKCKFVLKNNLQRQEGIKLANNIKEINKGLKDNYFLVQEYLEDPYIISKRKINIRYYLLIICTKDEIKGYIHKNGFMYYTPKLYKPGTLDFNEHITTGYIDRKVYDENPLTLEDFNQHLDNISPQLSKQFFHSVANLFNLVMTALHDKICKSENLKNNTLFQLFGADIAPDKDLIPKLMELNKGPDLGAKDARDKEVKIKVQTDIIDLIDDESGIKLDKPNDFVLVYAGKR